MSSAKKEADKLLDEILIATVIHKPWDYKRIADFAIDKQIEILKPFDYVPDIANKIAELIEIQEAIEKLNKS